MSRRLIWFPLAAGGDVSDTITAAQLSLTGAALTQTIYETIAAAQLTLTGAALTQTISETIASAQLSLNGAALTQTIYETIAPAQLSLTGGSLTTSISSPGTTSDDITPAQLSLTGAALTQTISETVSPAQLTLTGSALTQTISDTISPAQLSLTGGSLTVGISEIADTITPAQLSLLGGTLTTDIVIPSTGGGAARGKRKKPRKLKKRSEFDITQIIHNLESDRKIKDGVIENTRKVVEPVSYPLIGDTGPLKETLTALLSEKQEVQKVVKEVQKVTEKVVEPEKVEVIQPEYATKQDIQDLNVKLDLILKRLDGLSKDMETIAALAAS